jgi:SAM-dependent methyltransferase
MAPGMQRRQAMTLTLASEVAYQRSVYQNRYATARRLQNFIRYDGRYRKWLMEDCFRRHAIPFERQRVFELGFGSGELLLRFDVTSEIHGCELSESAVRALEADARIGPYRHQLVISAPDGFPRFPANDYDVMIASHVIEHVPDDLGTLRLMREHLRPRGWALFFLPLEPPRHNPDHARTYTAAGFTERLRESGFEPVHVEENFRYASHFVQVINWPSRARLPVVGPLIEAVKNVALALPPTAFIRLVEEPLASLHVAPYQLMVLARRGA